MLIISIAQMMMSSAAGVGAEGLVDEIGRYRNCDQAAVSSYWGDLTEWTWNCCMVKRLTDVRRTKSEVYEGVSHVFCDESTQMRTSSLRSSGCRRKCICLESLGIGFGDAERCFIRIDGGFICRMFPHLVVSCSLKQSVLVITNIKSLLILDFFL
uniref:Uncharacterized protein n=1 Tax=Helianthus annuus TaxID=4232 RepID=A0A251VLD5_HELAN